jgi:hypothetical protein
VALDRQSIQKQDFPVGDGGYERDAVDAHLRALADQVEELQRSSGAPGQSLADAASERIRAIVAGAEASAAEIERHAVDDADRIRADAGNDAAAIRQQAKEQAHADVGKVNESTAEMISRLEAMKNELNALFESLRAGSERLKAELERLEGHMGQVREATGASEPAGERHPVAPDEHSALVEEGALHAPAPAPPEPSSEAETPAEPEAPAWPDDTEGARLIALNMALNGTPREETDRYLAQHYKLNDRGGLLDEVYASVEG